MVIVESRGWVARWAWWWSVWWAGGQASFVTRGCPLAAAFGHGGFVVFAVGTSLLSGVIRILLSCFLKRGDVSEASFGSTWGGFCFLFRLLFTFDFGFHTLCRPIVIFVWVAFVLAPFVDVLGVLGVLVIFRGVQQ